VKGVLDTCHRRRITVGLPRFTAPPARLLAQTARTRLNTLRRGERLTGNQKVVIRVFTAISNALYRISVASLTATPPQEHEKQQQTYTLFANKSRSLAAVAKRLLSEKLQLQVEIAHLVSDFLLAIWNHFQGNVPIPLVYIGPI